MEEEQDCNSELTDVLTYNEIAELKLLALESNYQIFVVVPDVKEKGRNALFLIMQKFTQILVRNTK